MDTALTVKVVDRGKLGARGLAMCAVAGVGGTLILRAFDTLEWNEAIEVVLTLVLAVALVAVARRLIVRPGRPDIAIDSDVAPLVDAALRRRGVEELRAAIAAGRLAPAQRAELEAVLRDEREHLEDPDDAAMLAAVEARVAAAA